MKVAGCKDLTSLPVFNIPIKSNNNYNKAFMVIWDGKLIQSRNGNFSYII